MTQTSERYGSGIKIVRLLAERNKRVFTFEDAALVAQELGYSATYVKNAIFYLKQNKWIEPVRRGLYKLSTTLITGSPVHEFEVAMHLFKRVYISHNSAIQFHGLTDQIPRHIYCVVPTGICRISNKQNNMKYDGIKYVVSQVNEAAFWGMKKEWVGDARVNISTIPRTIIDALSKPQYCGGFNEVMYVTENALNQGCSVESLIEVSLKLESSQSKRLGWVLEKLGVNLNQLTPLQSRVFKGYTPLDVSNEKRGPYNKTWQIQENL